MAYYTVFDPLQQLGDQMLRVFGLREGKYVALAEPWLEQIGLGLTIWEGEFEGVSGTWLRWCDRDGQILPTGAERAAQAEAKAAKLATRLRELGIDPNQVGE